MAKKVNPQLAALRDQAKKRERDAARKVARLESQGIKVSGSQYDPRKGSGAIDRMTTAQVQAHLGRIEKFQSRKNQYVGIAGGAPVKRSQWRSFKRAERQLNNKLAEVKEPMREAAGVKGRPLNESTDAFFRANDFKPRSIASVSALKRLTQGMKRGATDEGMQKRIERARNNIEAMCVATGDLRMVEMIRGMSDAQVIFLWENTNFAASISHKYEIHKAAGDEPLARDRAEISETRTTQAWKLLDQVKGMKGRK